MWLAYGKQKMESKRGMLIVFEGLDRSGKSTQCERLVRHLRRNGEHVEHMRFPNRTTPIGQMINTYLTGQSQQEDHVIHLLFAANRWESAKDIENCISAGTTVVIDRYSYSGCVYSAAKEVNNMDLAWCRQPEVGLPRPDVCLFLDISAEEAAKRGGFGKERYEKQDLQDRVRELYERMRDHPDEGEDIVRINAGRSMEEVEAQILRVVNDTRRKVDEWAPDLRYVRPW
jgi:dTMP kinase